VPPDYDPLIAKLLVVDDDRDLALDRLARALDEVEIGGVQTTLPFHRVMARDDGFRTGPPSIDWVDEHWDEVLAPVREAALAAAGRAAAAAAADLVPTDDGAVVEALAQSSTGPATARDGRNDPGATAWTRAGRLRSVDR